MNTSLGFSSHLLYWLLPSSLLLQPFACSPDYWNSLHIGVSATSLTTPSKLPSPATDRELSETQIWPSPNEDPSVAPHYLRGSLAWRAKGLSDDICSLISCWSPLGSSHVELPSTGPQVYSALLRLHAFAHTVLSTWNTPSPFLI